MRKGEENGQIIDLSYYRERSEGQSEIQIFFNKIGKAPRRILRRLEKMHGVDIKPEDIFPPEPPKAG